MACEYADQPYRLQVPPSWMMKVMGWIISVLRENEEMMYQLENDYQFGSSKFELAYGLKATPYREGVEACLK